MGGLGSDVAIEAADIILQTDQPSKIAEAIRIGRRTRAVVWQNIIGALGVKLLVLALGASGAATFVGSRLCRRGSGFVGYSECSPAIE